MPRILLLGLGLIIAIAVTVWRSPEPELRYQGHSLREWIVACRIEGLNPMWDAFHPSPATAGRAHLNFPYQSEKPNQRTEAVRAVREIGTAALPNLLSWMRGPSAWRRRASDFLGNFDQWPLIPSLRRSLFDERLRYEEQIVGMTGLIVLGQVSTNYVYEPARSEGDQLFPEYHTFSMTAAQSGDEGVAALLKFASDSAVPQRSRIDALSVPLNLRRSGKPIAFPSPELAKFVADPDWELSKAAIGLICTMGGHPEYYAPALVTKLNSANDDVRIYITELVRRFRIADPFIVQELWKTLSDPDVPVNQRSLQALTELSPLTVLTSTNSNLQLGAIQHIAELNFACRLPLSRKDPNLTLPPGSWVIDTTPGRDGLLFRIGPPEFLPALRACLNNSSEPVRRAATNLLQEIQEDFPATAER